MSAVLKRLCYIGFHVLQGQQLASHLMQRFGFELFAIRETERKRQQAFRRGDAIFVVNEERELTEKKFSSSDLPSDCYKHKRILYDVNLQYRVSTASNICFEVEDVPGISRNLQEKGCKILIPPTTEADENGFVTYSVVMSIVGNVSHTLLDRSQYGGPFLPGFCEVEVSPKKFQKEKETVHFDHITYACLQGSSQAVLDWYKNCFGFQRFFIHHQDDAAEGFRIQGEDMGLRLTAMQYSDDRLSPFEPDCKFVLAESLPRQRMGQVDTFLQQHEGAGIQHVALYTTDIVSTAAAMAKSGVSFFKPSASYYNEKSKEKEMQQIGQDLQLLKDYGILFDATIADKGQDSSPSLLEKQYLMQIFTKPLFTEETFFIELIERHGAAGFGEGNVRALWKSVQDYMDQQQRPTLLENKA
ncbi:4-hydroxyphenylpyruvate dioxygenase-like protein [Pantherophis guttatus]|uniref:4-hydroxyphenylpyruvate dioxygenase n=1 Tax=Pantherophis guttatus TaxID=94885 RepID=A0A6P9BHS3_PANGU|nr:4-hydroxyphenylpyruvate dioxygenase-like protein [Pantherophis guttatus]XP_034270823.1 4-hydroxyphenylpyruvate dioxygenase-like protein [Pantherophis guttatus]XP_034270824.1 4-hydroxyphenylpyruvate dioxygenase-like protein [Pantherophis guttatus]XP_060545871.1 4-hydroxyphenylpyruvate dioxygenase-like protein [Pantherophis guttatus]